MAVQYAKGDIFHVGYDEKFEFILVFGHLSLNEIGMAWKDCRIRLSDQFKGIKDPFGIKSPVMFSEGKWIQFVPAAKNGGTTDRRLKAKLEAAFEWSHKKGLRTIITNGIRNTDHGHVTAENRASDDRRVRYIDKTVRQYERQFKSIKLISLNDAFIRNLS